MGLASQRSGNLHPATTRNCEEFFTCHQRIHDGGRRGRSVTERRRLRGETLMRVLQVRLALRRKAGIAMLLTFGHGLDWMKLNAEHLNNRLRH
jgi:hypothetical protein